MAKEIITDAAPVIDPGEEYVDFTIPYGGENRPVFIGVNGDSIRVRPGETVTVKRKFVEAWRNAQAQERAAWQTQIHAQDASKRALADL